MVLLRNNFENSTGVRHVHETVCGEHQTEQTALPSVLNSNDEKNGGSLYEPTGTVSRATPHRGNTIHESKHKECRKSVVSTTSN